MRRETYPQGEATHLSLKWNLHHFSTVYCWISTCYYFPWGVKRPLNGNSFSFAPEGKEKRRKWHVLRDDRAPLLDRFFTSPTQPPNEVLLFPIYRWENRIREVKRQCQSLTAMVWVHPGCITRPMDSERHVFIPAAASVHDPTLQGLQTSRLWGMVRWSRTAGQGLPFPWTQDKGGSSLNPREMLVRPSTATARGLSPTPSFYGRKLEPQPGPKLKLEAQQAYVNFTLISYVPNFFFLSLFVVLTNELCSAGEWFASGFSVGYVASLSFNQSIAWIYFCITAWFSLQFSLRNETFKRLIYFIIYILMVKS